MGRGGCLVAAINGDQANCLVCRPKNPNGIFLVEDGQVWRNCRSHCGDTRISGSGGGERSPWGSVIGRTGRRSRGRNSRVNNSWRGDAKYWSQRGRHRVRECRLDRKEEKIDRWIDG